MNPVWLILIVPSSVFLGIAVMCWLGIRATNDFQAAIARRDKMIEHLCVMASAVHVGLQVSYKDGILRSETGGLVLRENVDK